MIYFSSFFSGVGDIVSGFVAVDLSVRIITVLDGLIEYRAKVSSNVL